MGYSLVQQHGSLSEPACLKKSNVSYSNSHELLGAPKIEPEFMSLSLSQFMILTGLILYESWVLFMDTKYLSISLKYIYSEKYLELFNIYSLGKNYANQLTHIN